MYRDNLAGRWHRFHWRLPGAFSIERVSVVDQSMKGLVSHGGFLARGVTPELGISPGMGIYVIIRPPPFDLADREIVDQQPAPDPLVPGAEPELAEDEWGERERTQSGNLVRELLVVKPVRVDMVPGLPYLHEAERCGLEDLEIIRKVPVGIIHPAVSHPLGKCPGLRDRSFRFFSACHRSDAPLRIVLWTDMQYPEYSANG